MLNTEWFGDKLAEYNFDFYSGVPCSLLKPLINYGMSRQNYLAAVNEGDAVAHCAGAWIGGRKAVVMMQNSGLGNAVSPLTSLNYPFKIPVLGFVSLRGEVGVADEPQHELMGQITGDLLTTMRVEWQYLSGDQTECEDQIRHANQCIEAGKCFFFVVRKGTFEAFSLDAKALPKGENKSLGSQLGAPIPARATVLEQVARQADRDTVLLATTGVTGRELYQVGHKPNQLYMVGSMGCISPLALGLALVRPDLKVVAIDGDGALLMRMGNMATLAAYGAPNLLHLLLDNGVHESTGNQQTVSDAIDFTSIAAACGYQTAFHTDSLVTLADKMADWSANPGSCFIRFNISAGHASDLIRPTESPEEILQQFRANIATLNQSQETSAGEVTNDDTQYAHS